jgi:hypothetical protein
MDMASQQSWLVVKLQINNLAYFQFFGQFVIAKRRPQTVQLILICKIISAVKDGIFRSWSPVCVNTCRGFLPWFENGRMTLSATVIVIVNLQREF